MNGSTNVAETGCCWACVPVIPTTSSSAPGSTGVRARHLPHRRPSRRALLIDKVIAGCADDEVPEIRSLGKTLASWRTEILAHHDTGASNGPTEGLNLCVKKVKRCGHGFRSFENYRLSVLLHADGVTWPSRPRPSRIRTRVPYSDA